MKTKYNEQRCVAHQIILDLFKAKQAGQIQLLLMACVLADKQLDPENHDKRMRELQPRDCGEDTKRLAVLMKLANDYVFSIRTNRGYIEAGLALTGYLQELDYQFDAAMKS